MGAIQLPSIIFSLALVFLTACSSRQDVAKSIAVSAGFSAEIIPSPTFDIFSYSRLSPRHPILTVYIEGDGYAWASASRVSDDPTPKDPVALRLAARDPSPSVAYVARPCQYVMDTRRRGCSAAYWANGRFSPEVIEAEAAVIRALMARAGATRLRVVGYSGGGTVALLLPQYGIRPESIITVAGVLDPTAWVRLHELSPLVGSLDPADTPAAVANIRQVHFVGGADRVVPAAIAESYGRRVTPGVAMSVISIPGYTHECCWSENWPRLLREAEAKLAPP